ncbi:MAG: TolC family protein [Bacteroidales bacterium]|nr:TolC family protein [Bacteroidales bacterium]
MMKYKRVLFLFAFVIGLFTTVLYARDVHVFTMSDVILLAKQQSPDASIAKHQFRSQFWQYRSFLATKLPQMSLAATTPSYSRTIDGVQQPDGTVSYLERQYLDTYGSVNIRQQIGFSGGEVFLTSGLRRYDNISENTIGTSYTSIPIVNVGLSQPLFQYNAYKWAKQIEPMRYEEACRNYLETMERISERAVTEFFSLLAAQIDLQIAQKNMAAYDTLFTLSKGRFQMGKIPETDLLQIELQLLQATSNVENCKINYDNQLIQFKSFLRLQDRFSVALVPPQIDNFLLLDVNEVTDKAVSNSSTALSFQRRMIEAESNLNRSKMEGRFDATLYASYGLTATGDKINDAYHHPTDQQQVRLGLSVPIYDWGVARGKIKMAESNLELTQIQVRQEDLDWRQDIFVKVARFNMQQQQLTIAAKSDTIAQKSYLLTQQRYVAGKEVTFLDINNAQIQSDNALKNYFNVMMNYWRSYYELRRLTLFDWERREELRFNEKELLR